MLKALNFYKDLVDSGAAPKRVATIVTYNDFNAAAIAGTAAMFEGGHWQHFQLKEAMPAEQFAKWEASELPGPTAEQRSTGTGGWTLAALSKDPEKVKLCMDLVREVYMGPANEVMGQLPTRKSLFENLEAFKDPFFAKMNEYLVHGQARPGVPIYPEISNQIQIMMGEVLSGTKAAGSGARRRLGARQRRLRQALSQWRAAHRAARHRLRRSPTGIAHRWHDGADEPRCPHRRRRCAATGQRSGASGGSPSGRSLWLFPLTLLLVRLLPLSGDRRRSVQLHRRHAAQSRLRIHAARATGR